jgi:hypothetical protein
MTVKFARFLTVVLVLLMVVGLAGVAQALEPAPGAEIHVNLDGKELAQSGPPIVHNVKLWIGQNQALVNGESKNLDTAPMLYKERTMVPLRFIAESLGADVQWDPAEQKIMIAAGHKGSGPAEKTQFDVILKIGHNQALVNGNSKTLDVPPMLYEKRTMVPLRFIAEALGANVKYDSAEQSVTISLAAKDSPTPIRDEEMEIVGLGFEKKRAEIKIAMQEAAQQAKIKLAEADPVVVIGKESQLTEPYVKVVNAAIQGVDALNTEQLAKGADVLFTFMHLPKDSELPSGFYVIHVKGDPKANKWVAQFKNTERRVVLEKPAEFEKEVSAPRDKVKVTAKISFPGPTVTLDIHWSSASIQTAFRLDNYGPDTTPLATEKSTVQNSKKALDAFINATTKALTQAAGKYGNGILDGWMSLSRGDDFFVAYTVFEGVNDLTIEELKKGQDAFFGYFHTSKLPPGFYKVRIVQESGRWLGRFVNDKGEVVYEGPAEVTEGEYAAKTKHKGKFTGDVGPNSATVDYHWTDRKGRERTIEITIKW